MARPILPSAFSEVVDEPNRYWTPDWYSWLKDQASSVATLVDGLADLTARTREKISVDRTYFVRTADGSDTNDGLTDSATGSFKTIKHAVDLVQTEIDAGFKNLLIKVGDGSYTEGTIFLGALVGGSCEIRGNTASPTSVIINGLFYCSGGVPFGWYIDGMKLTNATGFCVDVDGGFLQTGLIDWGSASGVHIFVHNQGVYYSNEAETISGDATQHWCLESHSFLRHRGPSCALSGSRTFSQGFLTVNNGSNAQVDGMVFSGPAATGPRFAVINGSSIWTNGAGLSYFPGSIAGTILGGFYDERFGCDFAFAASNLIVGDPAGGSPSGHRVQIIDDMDLNKLTNDTNWARLFFYKTRSGIFGDASVAVASSSGLGLIAARASDGTGSFQEVAQIAFGSGTVVGSSVPGQVRIGAGTNGSTDRIGIDHLGNIVVGTIVNPATTGALATGATSGFLYIPTCAGTPTGTPTIDYVGRAPMIVDSTNNRLYFYSSGAWRNAGP